jgi:hypothetical protein
MSYAYRVTNVGDLIAHALEGVAEVMVIDK